MSWLLDTCVLSEYVKKAPAPRVIAWLDDQDEASLYLSVISLGEIGKGIYWLLLKNPENLDDTRNERQRLDEALKLNEPLTTVYYMKEELRAIWHQPDKNSAQKALDEWVKKAAASDVDMLKQFSKTIAAHRSDIIAYFDFDGLSTGSLDDINNKIKTLRKMAYGFRDIEFFKLKIMALHETHYALVG